MIQKNFKYFEEVKNRETIEDHKSLYDSRDNCYNKLERGNNSY